MNDCANTLREEFKRECKIIDLSKEYEGYSGEERWAIITDLTRLDLMQTYVGIVERYAPFVLLSKNQGEAIHKFQKNEKKYYMRQIRKGQMYAVDDEGFDDWHPEIATEDILDDIVKSMEYEEVMNLVLQLNPIQKRRVIKHFVQDMTYREIAREEGVSHVQIKKSIDFARKAIKKKLQ